MRTAWLGAADRLDQPQQRHRHEILGIHPALLVLPRQRPVHLLVQPNGFLEQILCGGRIRDKCRFAEEVSGGPVSLFADFGRTLIVSVNGHG